MVTLGLAWAAFAACAGAIAYAGTRLCEYGDVIAARLGLSRTWIGLALLATATSLPELVTGISSVALLRLPDIAVGDALGSCLFNLAILGALDLWVGRGGEALENRRHAGAGAFGALLLALVAIAATVPGAFPAWGHVGLYSPLFLGGYIVAMRSLSASAPGEAPAGELDGDADEQRLSLRQAGRGYAVHAAVVLLAGSWMPAIASRLAALMGWSESFVGTLFVACVTSLPELAVTIGALRVGSLDMAVGNLLGSNLFDIAILGLDDLLFLPGPLLAHASGGHAGTAWLALAMTGVALVGLGGRHRRVLRGGGAAGGALLLLYAAGVWRMAAA